MVEVWHRPPDAGGVTAVPGRDRGEISLIEYDGRLAFLIDISPINPRPVP